MKYEMQPVKLYISPTLASLHSLSVRCRVEILFLVYKTHHSQAAAYVKELIWRIGQKVF